MVTGLECGAADSQSISQKICRLCCQPKSANLFRKHGRLCKDCHNSRTRLIASDPSIERLQLERRPILERILSHRSVSPSGCWLWTGCKDVGGYGRISNVYIDGKKYGGPVHRFVAHIFHGLDLSERNQYACHYCDTPACFNPDHIFVGTPQDNSDDCRRKGRERHQSGDENGGGHKLTAQDVLQIRARHKSGETQKVISQTYAIDPSMVSRIVLRKAWRNV